MTDAVQGRTWCWFWFHQWAKWQTFEERYAALHDNNPITGEARTIGGHVCYQKRICERCGKVQLRRETAS